MSQNLISRFSKVSLIRTIGSIILLFSFFSFVDIAFAQVVNSPAGTRTDYAVGSYPTVVAFDNITNSIWVGSQSYTVSKIDIFTGTKVDYSVGVSNNGIAFDSVTNSIWVTNYFSRSVSKINIVTGARVDYPIGMYPAGVAFDNVTNSVWVANVGSGTVSKVDIFSGSRVDYPVGLSPYRLAFDSVTNSVWVANVGSGTVSKIDIFTGTKVDYSVGAYPIGIAFDNVTNSIWVTNYFSRSVSKIDIFTGTKVDYSVGNYPNGIAFDNVTNSVWVANQYSNTVSKIAIGGPQLPQFFSQVNHSGGVFKLRQTAGTKITGTQTDKPASDVIKTVPADWVLKVATTTDTVTGQTIELDGYQWYGVVDVTDGAIGWMVAREISTGTIYLPYDANAQSTLDAKATTMPYQTKEARTPVILQAVDTYYTATATSSSLYGGGGGHDSLNNFQRFIQGASYPKELVLAIAGHESAGTLDNEICSSAQDGGIGIMQITSEGFKGLGSALKNYPKTGDCRTNFPTSKYYSNALQGIYANIKDGFRTLQEKYRRKCPDAQLTIGTLVYSCQDIERVLATWGYNGKVLTGNYLKQISNSLRDLSIYFPGIDYANNDQLIEKLKLANANRIEFKKFSPVEIEVIDSLGRATGFDGTSVIREEIPFSRYDRDADGGVIFFPHNPYTYRVIGTGIGTYGFRVEFTQNDILRTFYATNIPATPGEIHEYFIDWDALDRGERGVTVGIDTNGDGVVDRVIQSDSSLTEIDPPAISVVYPSGEYLLNATTTAQFYATDVSGIAILNATLNENPVINGQQVTMVKPGVNMLELVAMDNEGNTATTTSTFNVLYATNGFLSPIKSDGSGVYNQGRTLPVKFGVRDVNNNAVPSVFAYLYVAKISDSVVGNDEIPLSTSVADTGNQFRYDTSGQHYLFNLSTSTMSPGSWQLKAVLDSGQIITSVISIR